MKPITDLWVTDDVVLVTLANMPNDMGRIASIFDRVAAAGINVDLICQTPPYQDTQDLSFSIGEDELDKALNVLAGFQKESPGVKTDVNPGNTKLSFGGEAMRTRPGVAAAIFDLLARSGVTTKLISTSETSVSVLVSAQDVDRAVEAAEAAFGVTAK